MLRNSSIFLHISIYCTLLGLAYGIIGPKVRYAEAHHYPFVVSLSKRPNNTEQFYNLHFCTGTLITEKSVLTAAHCLTNKHVSEVLIYAGAVNLKKSEQYLPEYWTTYNEWSKKNSHEYSIHDIAVIILKDEGIIKSKRIHPAHTLSVGNAYLEQIRIRMLGWGNLEHGGQPISLRTAILKVLPNDECNAQGTKLKGKKFTMPPYYFCSKADPWVVSSPGDGGGPIVDMNRQVVGINIGTCPKLVGYEQQYLNEHQLNCHIHLYYYKLFLTQVMK